MITQYDTKVLKIKDGMTIHGKTGEVKIRVDKSGTPIDKNWRRRIKDAEIDGCVEVVKPATKKKENKK